MRVRFILVSKINLKINNYEKIRYINPAFGERFRDRRRSFAVSFVVKKSGTVKASDLGLPFFYIAPLQEGEVTITPLNNNEKVTLPSDFVKNNVGGFLPIQLKEVESVNDLILGL